MDVNQPSPALIFCVIQQVFQKGKQSRPYFSIFCSWQHLKMFKDTIGQDWLVRICPSIFYHFLLVYRFCGLLSSSRDICVFMEHKSVQQNQLVIFTEFFYKQITFQLLAHIGKSVQQWLMFTLSVAETCHVVQVMLAHPVFGTIHFMPGMKKQEK